MRHGLRSGWRWRSWIDVQVNDLLVGHDARLVSLEPRKRPHCWHGCGSSCYDVDMSAGDGVARERVGRERSEKGIPPCREQ